MSMYQPATNEWTDDYRDDIKDKKYQKLLKAFRKADEVFFNSNFHNDPEFEKKKQKAVDAESKLDAYCLAKGYNQELGWI